MQVIIPHVAIHIFDIFFIYQIFNNSFTMLIV